VHHLKPKPEKPEKKKSGSVPEPKPEKPEKIRFGT
jgi:hypothetical protein